MQTPLVSIIIPILEVNSFLYECLFSLTRIKYSSVEIILITESGLSDSARLEIMKTLGKTNFEIRFVTNSRKGLASALNTGINACLGEYVARLDSDDLIMPNRIRSQVDFLNSNHQIGIVGGQVEFIDSNSLRIEGMTSKYPTKSSEMRIELLNHCCISHPTVMFRKATFLEAGQYSEKFQAAEDYDLWLRFLKLTEVVNLTEVVTRYRIHDSQLSNNTVKTLLYATVARILYFDPSLREVFDSQSFNSLESFIHKHGKLHFQKEVYFQTYYDLMTVALQQRRFKFAVKISSRLLEISIFKTLIKVFFAGIKFTISRVKTQIRQASSPNYSS